TEIKLPFGDTMVDYGSPFDRIAYFDLFERALGFPASDTERVRKEAPARHAVSPESAGKLDPILLINAPLETVAAKSHDPRKPPSSRHSPAALSPLTRPNPKDPRVADRADLFIGHMELAPHYTELNDPDVQEAKFREQLAGLNAEEATFRTFDADFIRALKVG